MNGAESFVRQSYRTSREGLLDGLVGALGHTADLAGRGVFLQHTLGAGLVDRGNSSQDSCVLVSGFGIDGSVCLLDDCFQVGLNGLVVRPLCGRLNNAVLLRFDVRQFVPPPWLPITAHLMISYLPHLRKHFLKFCLKRFFPAHTLAKTPGFPACGRPKGGGEMRYTDMADELFDGCVAHEMTLSEAIVRGVLPAPKYVLSLYAYQKELERYRRRARKAGGAARQTAEQYIERLRRRLEEAGGLDRVFQKHLPDRHGKYLIFCADYEHLQKMRCLQ